MNDFLFFCNLLRNFNFKIISFVFISFNFSFLKRSNSFILLKLLLVDRNIDFELLSSVQYIVSLFLELR